MKKGFTLVELMAIIVLLAVVMAMIVPTIIGVIESSKKDAFMSDVKSIIREINNELASGTYYDITQLNVDDLKNVFQIDTKNIYFISADEADGEITYSVIGANEWEGYLAQGTYENIEILEATTPPAIALYGSSTVTIEVGQTYMEAGATAQDSLGFSLDSRITISGTVNNLVAGTYVLTYSVEDYSGNIASVTRTISVIATAIPTVAFGMNGNATYAKTRSTTVTVSDNGSVNPSSLEYQWTTSTTAPTEASFTTPFTNGATLSTPAGVSGGYYLWIIAKDLVGNTMIARTSVFNLDNTGPVITLTGDSITYLPKGGGYVELGATSTDAISGGASVSISGTINEAVIGSYTKTYSSTDAVGNSSSITRTVNVITANYDFAYTGAAQTFTVPAPGVYKVELWGAGPGTSSVYAVTRGKAAYVSGYINWSKDTNLYLFVGGQNGYNGGGGGESNGGGATDIRLANGIWNDTTGLRSRIMVAAGGGAGVYSGCTYAGNQPGHAGGLSGVSAYFDPCSAGYGYSGYGASQTAGGAGGKPGTYTGVAGGFGYGGTTLSSVGSASSGGGGGYYGGGSGTHPGNTWSGGGGGSSFVSGCSGCNAINSSGTHTGQPNHYSGMIFENSTLAGGYNYVLAPGGTGESGHDGNGSARITYLGVNLSSVDVLLVGGGGGGGGGETNPAGDAGGGGGAGGVLYIADLKIAANVTYTVTVGSGGAGATGSSLPGSSGLNSSFASLIAYGGGGGAAEDGVGISGGSGGGGGGSCSTGDHYGGIGAANQGNAGGIGIQSSCNYRGGAGGGGASGAGTNDLSTGAGGTGGSGIANSISGSSIYYGGGGGGGAGRNVGALGGAGGTGGGGAGGSSPSGAGVHATANTGGGGGGAGSGTNIGGNGGSGIVIIRYLGTQKATGGTITSSGGYTIHTFTSSGTFTLSAS